MGGVYKSGYAVCKLRFSPTGAGPADRVRSYHPQSLGIHPQTVATLVPFMRTRARIHARAPHLSDAAERIVAVTPASLRRATYLWCDRRACVGQLHDHRHAVAAGKGRTDGW